MSGALLSFPTGRFLADAGDGEELGVHISYDDLYHAIVFLTAIYAAGFIVGRFLKMPSLVGEIFVGIILGPSLLDFVPSPETFVLLGEIGLILLVLEAGIDIDLTTLRLIGARGVIIALVGTFLPIVLAFTIARMLGYGGVAAVAAGCTFAPTSLGIAMNILRRTGIVNTPVGQLIVAAAIIDDMVALVILSQLQAFAGEGDITIASLLIPVASALGFLVIGGYLAIFVLPKFLDWLLLSRIHNDKYFSREWMSLAVMFLFLLGLIPATRAAKASPLMGAFLAGLVFCSDGHVHHMFVSQFKRVMQWLLRIFFAASIGFQVPIKKFASATVILQGLLFTLALLGKVAVGFMVPNLSSTNKFRGMHLRDCLVVGFSMAAEGEFAFVIAVFAVAHNMITQELYAAVVLAVLLSTILAPLLLRLTISYFNKQVEKSIYDAKQDRDSLLKQGIKEKTVIFWCIQTKSAPAWGLHMSMLQGFHDLHLDVIDHRSWHPRQSKEVVVNEVYARDMGETAGPLNELEAEKRLAERSGEISRSVTQSIGQANALIRVQRWVPDMPEYIPDDVSVSEHIVRVTSTRLERAAKERRRFSELNEEEEEEDNYIKMEDQPSPRLRRRPSTQISHLDDTFTGRLEGLFRHDLEDPNHHVADEGFEMVDVHGIGTGFVEVRERHDVHGASLT